MEDFSKESIAKQELFDFDQIQTNQLYDPYRNNNLLKHSSQSLQTISRNAFKSFYQDAATKDTANKKGNNSSHRDSLKRILRRLQSIPSPRRKSVSQSLKVKRMKVCPTQAIKNKQNKKVMIKTFILNHNGDLEKEKSFLKSAEYQKDRSFSKIVRPASHYSGCKQSVETRFGNNRDENKVRNLIKKKMASKNQGKVNNKTEKLIHFLKQNTNCCVTFKKKNESKTILKTNSKKLINLLC